MNDVLRSMAASAAKQAYAPHSGFHVGAALRSQGGQVYVGCNVENASFPVAVCAERAAICAAVVAEGAAFRLAAIAVIAFDRDGQSQPVTPCGACRQALVEFGDEAEVSYHDGAGGWLSLTAGDLLPHRFVLSQR